MTSQPAPSPTATYEFASFRAEVGRQLLLRDGHPVVLPPRAFALLIALIERRDDVVDKDELLRVVWPQSFVSEDSLSQCVSALRKALGDDSTHPQVIATVPRRGYRFIATVREPSNPASEASRRPSWPWFAAPASVVLAIAGLTAGWWQTFNGDRSGSGPLVRFTQSSPDGASALGGALSPDGARLAFVVRNHVTGRTRLSVRVTSSEEIEELPDTEGASRPFWSPDGQTIGFFSDARLKLFDLNHRRARALVVVGPNATGGSWSRSGVILFAARSSALRAISVSTGEMMTVTTLDATRHEVSHRWPQFLPDGRRFLFAVLSSDDEVSGTYVGSLGDQERKRVLPSSCEGAIYASSGHLLCIQDGALMAYPFDLTRERVTGSPLMLASNATAPSPENLATISAAGTTLLSFDSEPLDRRLTWYERDGRRSGTLNAPTVLANPILTADRKGLLADSREDPHRGVWMVDLERGTSERVTTHGLVAAASPDGTQVTFTSFRAGASHLYSRNRVLNTETLLFEHSGAVFVDEWSPDGRYLVFESSAPKTGRDLWLFSTAGDRRSVPLLQTEFEEIQGSVSPDGRWFAYASNESGSWQVYMRQFPNGGDKRIVSSDGGAQPQWRDDGRELFYLASDRRLMAVPMQPGLERAGLPEPLFAIPADGDLDSYRSHYVAANNGTRFLVDTTQTSNKASLTVLVNWWTDGTR